MDRNHLNRKTHAKMLTVCKSLFTKDVQNVYCSYGHSFAKRIVNTWNPLPDSVVLSKSVATFRHKVNEMHFSDYCGL